MKIDQILRLILETCGEHKIEFTLSREEEGDNEIILNLKTKQLTLNIVNVDDPNLIMELSECLTTIKESL